MNPKELTQKLNVLVAEAATTTDQEVKVKKIEEALNIACLFVKTLKPMVRDAIRDSVKRLPSGICIPQFVTGLHSERVWR